MRTLAAAPAVCLAVLLPLLAGLAGAKVPSEVLVQRIGISREGESFAVAVRDPDAMATFARVFWSEAVSSEPERGTTLRYSYVIYLAPRVGPPWESEFRYFYALTNATEPSYFFSVTDIDPEGGTSETVTRVFHHPELDELVLPYALPDAGIAWLSVGNSPGKVYPPTVMCSSADTCPEPEGPAYLPAVLFMGTAVVLVLLVALALHIRTKKRSP